VRTGARCDGLEDATAVDTYKERRHNGRRTSQWCSHIKNTTVTDLVTTTSACKETMTVGPRDRCQHQVSGLAYIPQTEAITSLPSHEVKVAQPIGYSKPAEVIREEEYAHMNRGNVFCN
jgi:hypothetical protein